MTDLTETQRTILTAAALRPGIRVLPLPDRIKGGAATKVLDALVARGLVEETAAQLGEPTVRDGVALVATAAAFHALGINAPADEADDATDDERASPTIADEVSANAGDGPASTAAARPKLRGGTKQAKMIAMLQGPDGATIDEIVAATGWQPHTVRGALSGALKKRLGMQITSEKVEGRGRVYRIFA